MKGIKLHMGLVWVILLAAIVYVVFFRGRTRNTMGGASTASGSSAWGSGGSGWQHTSTAGQNPGVARSPIAQTGTDPGAIPRYRKGVPARAMSPLVPGLAGLGGLRATNMAGSRPASQGPTHTIPIDPWVARYRLALARGTRAVNHIRRRRPYYP